MKKRSKTLLCHGMKFIRSFEQRRGRVLGEWERENEMWTGKLEINFVLGGMKWVSSGCYCHRRRRFRRSLLWKHTQNWNNGLRFFPRPTEMFRFVHSFRLLLRELSKSQMRALLFPLPDNNFRYKIFFIWNCNIFI